MLLMRITMFSVLLLSAVACGKKLKNSEKKSSKFAPSNSRVSDQNAFAQEVLFLAIASGDENLVRTELNHGANPNVLYQGKSALAEAIRIGDINIIRALIEAKANLALPNEDGKRPLEICIELGKEDIFVYLVSKNALDAYPDRLQLLIQAVKANQENIAMEIIISNTVFDLEKGLYYTKQRGLRRLHQFLVQIKQNPTINHGLLQSIVSSGDLAHLRYFGNRYNLSQVSNGANLLATSLLIRNISTRYQVIEYLLSRNFSANGQPNDSKNPLIVATQKEDLGALRMLVAGGGNINVIDQDKKTPLAYAVSNLDWKMVEYLLANGAERFYTTTDGYRSYIYNVCRYLRFRRGTTRYQTDLNRSAFNRINSLLLCED